MRRMFTYPFIVVVTIVSVVLTACTDPKEVPQLTRKLYSSDSSTRSQAALKLGRIGAPHARSAVPRLIQLLDDKNPGVRSGAAFALRKIGGAQAHKALEAKSGW